MRKGRGKDIGGRGVCNGLGRGKGTDCRKYGISAKKPLGSSNETNLHTHYLKKSHAPIIHEQKLETLMKISEEAVKENNVIKKKENAEKDANIPSIVAYINQIECSGCGICQDVCVAEALIVDEIAKVDTKKCNGCGTCVAECPNEAISLRKLEK